MASPFAAAGWLPTFCVWFAFVIIMHLALYGCRGGKKQTAHSKRFFLFLLVDAQGGSTPVPRQDEFGCRTLVLFKGAGFDFLSSPHLSSGSPVSASPVMRRNELGCRTLVIFKGAG